jgi:hypothetical protein
VLPLGNGRCSTKAPIRGTMKWRDEGTTAGSSKGEQTSVLDVSATLATYIPPGVPCASIRRLPKVPQTGQTDRMASTAPVPSRGRRGHFVRINGCFRRIWRKLGGGADVCACLLSATKGIDSQFRAVGRGLQSRPRSPRPWSAVRIGLISSLFSRT